MVDRWCCGKGPIVRAQRREHGCRWRRHQLCSAQSTRYLAPIALPGHQRQRPFDRGKPRKDTRMAHHQGRRLPGQGTMDIAIEMHHIRLPPGLEFEQPGASGCDVGPRSLHPFEFTGTFAHGKVLDLPHSRTLLRVEGWPHGGQHHVDAILLQCLGQVEGIGPHTADRVGGHQEALDRRVTCDWHVAPSPTSAPTPGTPHREHPCVQQFLYHSARPRF